MSEVIDPLGGVDPDDVEGLRRRASALVSATRQAKEAYQAAVKRAAPFQRGDVVEARRYLSIGEWKRAKVTDHAFGPYDWEELLYVVHFFRKDGTPGVEPVRTRHVRAVRTP